jgi:hypothetical protein
MSSTRRAACFTTAAAWEWSTVSSRQCSTRWGRHAVCPTGLAAMAISSRREMRMIRHRTFANRLSTGKLGKVRPSFSHADRIAGRRAPISADSRRSRAALPDELTSEGQFAEPTGRGGPRLKDSRCRPVCRKYCRCETKAPSVQLG